MEPFIRAAGGLLRMLGCEGITYQQVANRDIAKMTGLIKGKPVVIRVLVKAEWGKDLKMKTGQNWSDARYPYKSIQFLTPTPGEKAVDYTHYLLVSGCNNRLVLAPKVAIDQAPKGWLKDGDQFVQTAIVENWTPRVVFFIRTENGWEPDPENVWTKPVDVPMDADAFLSSL